MPTKPKTIILGGGISGLLAAWHLRAQGGETEVWEASEAPGGWAQTRPWPGPHGESGWLERGPQGVRFPAGSALDALLQDLALPLQPMLPQGPHWLGRAGCRFPSPLTAKGLLQAPGLDLAGRLRLLLEPLVPAGSDPEETLQAFMARRFGSAFAQAWLPALLAGVFAAPPERLGLDALPELKRWDHPGGILLGALALRSGRTRIPVGGTGALAQALAARVGCMRLNQPAEALEPLAGGRWRLQSGNQSAEADAVVLALPPRACADLLAPLAPAASLGFRAFPMLDLHLWHSRHPTLPGWERGFNLLVHPPDGRGLLGIVGLPAADPRGVPGCLQVRSYLGGAYAVDPGLEGWPGLAAELRRWLPELPDALQVREERCQEAFPLLEPDHRARVAAQLATLPPGLHWVGAARFGPGVARLAEAMRAWAATFPISTRPAAAPIRD
jgi:oxygen-dependent protoporphyrinogen oxidase